MPIASRQQVRQQGEKALSNTSRFFEQYVADGSFGELDMSMNDCATELLDSMEADRLLNSCGQDDGFDLENLPLMDWEMPSMGMEGMCDPMWQTSQNSDLTTPSLGESLNLEDSFQTSQCSTVAPSEDLMWSNDFSLNPSALTENDSSSAGSSSRQEPRQNSDSDSFALLNSAFRDLVQAKAAADSRCVSQKAKQRDASIALHLQRLRAACDQTEQLLGNSAGDQGLGSEQISAFGGEAEMFSTQLQNGTASGCLSSSGYCSTQNSPRSNCSNPSQRSLPELSSCSETFSPSATQFPSTAQTPAGSQEIHENGALEIVLDMNMNPSKSLPRKQKKRSQAQRERYQNVRKHGACLKHKKLKKLCTCFDNVAPRVVPCQKIDANNSKLEKSRSSLRTCQPTKAPRVNSGGTPLSVPSMLPASSTSPGHDRVLSGRILVSSTSPAANTAPGHDRLLLDENVQTISETLVCKSTPEPTSGSFLCLIPGCTYAGVNVRSLQSHYGSTHAREILTSTSLPQPWSPVMPRTTQQRSSLDAVHYRAGARQDVSATGIYMDSTTVFSQQQSTIQVQGTGRIDPDIDCRIVGSCESGSKSSSSVPQVPARLRLPDVVGDLLYEVPGVFSVPLVLVVGLLWSLFMKVFTWVLSNRPSIQVEWRHGLGPRGHFGNMVMSALG
ncbi:hypothetical protein FQN54_002644 [Arachnomyces sp. PD_36]|nr:hypothetical protein FQN54_002644 [Arachnomyces sp. PD_36]